MQPLVVAVQLGIVAALAEVGVAPSVVLGHSLGELTAACVAGAIDEGALARLVVARGRVMGAPEGAGAMLAVDGGEAEVGALPAGVVVAAQNGPRAVVLAGDPGALDAVAAGLGARGSGRCGWRAIGRFTARGWRGRRRRCGRPWRVWSGRRRGCRWCRRRRGRCTGRSGRITGRRTCGGRCGSRTRWGRRWRWRGRRRWWWRWGRIRRCCGMSRRRSGARGGRWRACGGGGAGGRRWRR
ncbi:MAG: acyltransferase domain-containing protein [Myxococcales bacterium]|nr:acyltransferase domain-containing protein [Myxococcales bacterium]